MKKILLFMLVPFLGLSQVQIGQDIDGENPGDFSGNSLSLSGNGLILAVGARGNDGNGSFSGHVRIYENISGTWTQIGQDIDGENLGDEFGESVSLSNDGTIIAIGADANDGNGQQSGHVRIYENISGTWTQIGQDIDGEGADDQSGRSVSLSNDGSIVAIGAVGNDQNGTSSGHVRVYENISGTWTQIGQDIDGEAPIDEFGTSVSISGNGSIVAIGAPNNNGITSGSDSGHVRVYQNISGTWTQIGQDIDGEFANDFSGGSVSISDDGSIIAIGAIGNDGNGSFSGHVRVYENQSNVWTQIGQDINGESTNNFSGQSVSLSNDGSIISIGAHLNNGNTGHVRIYENLSNVWTQVGSDIDGEAPIDQSGFSVSMSDNGFIVAIGANRNDGNGTDSGHVRVYDLSALLSSDSFVLENFTMSPNPTTDKVIISLNNNLELKEVSVYNYFGQKIKTTQSTEIDLSEFPTGVYFLEIETNKGKASRKVVKK